MGRDEHFLLEQLAQVIVIEGHGAQVFVQLVGGVVEVLQNVPFDFLHHGGTPLPLVVRGQVAADQVAVGGKENRLFRAGGLVMVQRGPERVQQEMVAVVLDDGGRHVRQGGQADVQVDVFKALGAGVGVGEKRRDHHDVPLAVIQAAAVKRKRARAFGAVNEFPAFVGVALHSQHHFMPPRVDDLIHARHPFIRSVVNGIIPENIRFVHDPNDLRR